MDLYVSIYNIETGVKYENKFFMKTTRHNEGYDTRTNPFYAGPDTDKRLIAFIKDLVDK